MLEAKYGLPSEVRFCKRCVISNQRPNSAVEYEHTAESKKTTINFDAEGICDACRVAERKANIDWTARNYELNKLCNAYRSNGNHYDCLVPGSGGKDSFYQAHVLKYQYHMNPLTVTWAPHLYTDWGRRNHQRWIDAGFDNYLMTPNSRVHRLLTRLAVDNLLHPFQPFMLGQKFLAPKLAALMNIPLVFYGENEAEYGNPMQDIAQAQRDHKYFCAGGPDKVFLGGTSCRDLVERYGLRPYDIAPYMPISPQILREKSIQVHYLGYYLRWHPQEAYYYAVEHGDFEPSPHRTPGTWSRYNSLDDKIDDLHYWTTFIKFGIGRATYDAAQEIRNGEMTRDESVEMVRKYDGEWPARFEDELMRYLSIDPATFPQASKQFEQPLMTVEHFKAHAEKFKSPHLWDGDKLRHIVKFLPDSRPGNFESLIKP